MPAIAIHMVRGRSLEQKRSVQFAVRDALRDVFSMSEQSYSIRLFEFDQEDFYLPPPKTSEYLLIEIDCFPGRDEAMKASLFEVMLENLTKAGESSDQALIVIREPAMENWGFQK